MNDVVPLRPRSPHSAPDPRPSPGRPRPEPLWRELVGAELRRRRHDRDDTQGEVAGRAGISTQYLSEVERGVKEPSSEVLAAVAGSVGLSLLDLTAAISRRLGAPGLGSQRPRRPALRGPLALAA